jgi:hypothetical protein
MNARTRGKMPQNSPPPQPSTSPPARSIASHRGSAERTKSSAVATSTSSTAHMSVTISRREAAGRTFSESRFTFQRYDCPALRPHLAPAASARADHLTDGSVPWREFGGYGRHRGRRPCRSPSTTAGPERRETQPGSTRRMTKDHGRSRQVVPGRISANTSDAVGCLRCY